MNKEVASINEQQSKDAEWYKLAFDNLYIMIFDSIRPIEFTKSEIDNFFMHLNLKPEIKILDLGCGYGRHSIELAKRGYEVVGLDLSEALINKAKADSANSGVNVEWILEDMRNIPFTNEFDLIINNAFGYLETDEEEYKVIEQAYKALKPGGYFLQWEIPNREKWARSFLNYNVERHGEYLLVKENTFNPLNSREYQEFMLISKKEPMLSRKSIVRIYTLTELVEMHKKAGLEYIKHSVLDGSPLTFDSQEVMIISQKPIQ